MTMVSSVINIYGFFYCFIFLITHINQFSSFVSFHVLINIGWDESSISLCPKDGGCEKLNNIDHILSTLPHVSRQWISSFILHIHIFLVCVPKVSIIIFCYPLFGGIVAFDKTFNYWPAKWLESSSLVVIYILYHFEESRFLWVGIYAWPSSSMLILLILLVFIIGII